MNTVSIHLVLGGPRWCDTCNTTSRHPVYAYLTNPTDPLEVGSYCPNCTPKDTPMPHQNTPRRDPLGIAIASIFLLIAAGFITAAIILGGWAWLLAIPAAPLLLLGTAGLALDAVKHPRDASGRIQR